MPRHVLSLLHSGGIALYWHNNMHSIRLDRSMVSRIGIICLWVCGLVCGALLAAKTCTLDASLMRMVVKSRVSIIGLVLALFFPLVLTAVALITNMSFLVLPALFIKAVCFALCGCGLFITFGDAGWLVRWLFMFSDSCMVVFLLWFVLKHFAGDRETLKKDFSACCICAAFLGMIEILSISPFTAALF